MAGMKIRASAHLVLAMVILIVGGGIVGGEYFLVRWYPAHKERADAEALAPVAYGNTGLGISIEVAKGIYKKAEVGPNEVKLSRPGLFGGGPSLTIKSEPNPDGASEFTPQILAIWETDGSIHKIPRYGFEHTKVMDRDAVIIHALGGDSMVETLRVISPTRIIEADCTPGGEDNALYMQACDESLRTLKVEGPPSTPSRVTEAAKKGKPKVKVFKLQ
jgi:hypothetical protein